MNKQLFDFSVDLLKALLWQYESAERLQSLLRSKQEWYDNNFTQFWLDWYTDVFNLDTANEFGLDVWAIILDIRVNWELPRTERRAWGFGQFRDNFNNGNFGRSQDEVYQLTIEQRRLILKLRYYQLVARGSVTEFNEVMSRLFDQPVYALDGLDMTYTCVFTNPLPPDQQLVIDNFDLLIRPAGVKRKTRILNVVPWGFGAGRNNFNNGNMRQSTR